MIRYLVPALLLIAASGPLAADDLSGPVRVVDGDTLALAGTTINLWGYDAPELAQDCSVDGEKWSCGWEAAQHLQTFTQGKTVTCRQKNKAAPEDRLYKCAVGTLDLGAEMIEVGLALPDWPTSARYYIRSYQEARGQGRGMHKGSFEAPWDWRQHRALSD